ncbi:MAG: hydroxymyristoyl-ACP dehydratase, partial [Steroidobacteraceae bacterium]
KDHPALAGHFPDEPIVPGAVVLGRLLEAAEAQLGHALRIVGLPHAKFVAPLRPDEEACASLEIEGARLGFEVERDGRVIARGAFRLAADGPE